MNIDTKSRWETPLVPFTKNISPPLTVEGNGKGIENILLALEANTDLHFFSGIVHQTRLLSGMPSYENVI